jgi:adenosylcobinamide-phosphate synthase
MMNSQILVIIAAYLLDLIIGDPQWSWHPVRLIGRLIGRLERRFNTGGINKKFSGTLLLIIVVSVTMLSALGILRLAALIHPALYFTVSVILVYFSLSIKSLAVEAGKVYSALKNKEIREARNSLFMIVGRDTDKLEEPEIIRAAVETVAESSMDGIVAPLFFAFFGGPVLVWVYKAVNTLDSMVGHRNERFIGFGWASAKVDGLLNFIPAKITCVFISASSLFYGKNWPGSVKWGSKFLFKGQQDNSTAVEAAMAGALDIRLGGLNYYDSLPVTKELIGGGPRALEIKHIRESVSIVYLCSFLFLIAGIYLFNQSRLISCAKILFHNFCAFSGINSAI